MSLVSPDFQEKKQLENDVYFDGGPTAADRCCLNFEIYDYIRFMRGGGYLSLDMNKVRSVGSGQKQEYGNMFIKCLSRSITIHLNQRIQLIDAFRLLKQHLKAIRVKVMQKRGCFTRICPNLISIIFQILNSFFIIF